MAEPLRGEKSTTWNGGEQVPCIFNWPGKIKPPVNLAFMVNYDVYATLAKITGSTVRDGEAIDSLDMSGVLLAGEKSPRTKHMFFFHQPMAWRNGDYKIHFFTRERTRDSETKKKEESLSQDPPLLFNVKEDPGKRNNIAAQRPEIVERLTREFEQAQKDVKSGKRF